MAHETMAIEGTLDLFQLPEILQLVSLQGKTGILTVQGETDIVAISFERGKVVAADALNQTLEEALGAVLAGQGLVAPRAFAEVAAEHRSGRGRLMDLLVERSLVSRRQLLDALRLHTYTLLIELLRWRQGEFKFYTGDEVSFEEGFQPIGVEELLIRSVEDAANDGDATIPDSRSIYEPAPVDRPIRVRRDGEEVAPPDTTSIWLTSADQTLLEHLAGGAAVSALVKKIDWDEYRVRYGLHRLLEAGVARRRVPVEVVVPAEVAEKLVPVEPGAVLPTQPAEPPVLLPPPPRQEAAYTRHVVTAWPGRVMAVLPVLLALLMLIRTPILLVLPIPWQNSARREIERELVEAAHIPIDQAAKAYFLLKGKLPERLEDLESLRLISRAQLRDPLRRPWSWVPNSVSYELAPAADGIPDPQLLLSEAISGNFLLDPDFLSLSRSVGEKPLILLD